MYTDFSKMDGLADGGSKTVMINIVFLLLCQWNNMSLWASVLVFGGHKKKDFYRLVTNKYIALSRSVLLILSWLLISLEIIVGDFPVHV